MFVKPDFSKYSKASAKVRVIFREYDEEMDAASLDEAYLDVTDYCKAKEVSGCPRHYPTPPHIQPPGPPMSQTESRWPTTCHECRESIADTMLGLRTHQFTAIPSALVNGDKLCEVFKSLQKASRGGAPKEIGGDICEHLPSRIDERFLCQRI